MSKLPEVAVIIPTLALAEREALIHRALESVLTQRGVEPRPIVVVNGPDRDTHLVRKLEGDRRLCVIDLDRPSLPGALRAGRAAVKTEWFASLDDDDVYLPGGLAARVEALQKRPSCDAVLTNGLRRSAEGDQVHIADFRAVETAPLDALEERNWLLPGAWLCRTHRVGGWLFESMPDWLENTYLALQFSLRCELCFLDQATVAWYTDTPNSLSKSRANVHGQVPSLEKLLALPELPPRTLRWLRRSLTIAQHSVAHLNLVERNFWEASRWHLRSLTGASGWRYAPFGARLLFEAARSAHEARVRAGAGNRRGEPGSARDMGRGWQAAESGLPRGARSGD